jgi:hypothetical protein
MEYFQTVSNFWVIFGFIATISLNIFGIFLALRAHARLSKWVAAVNDMDWQQVSQLTTDVHKLKEQAQRWRSIENGEKATGSNSVLRNFADQVMSQNAQTKNRMLGG